MSGGQEISFHSPVGSLQLPYPDALAPRCTSTSSQYLLIGPLQPIPLQYLNLRLFLNSARTPSTSPSLTAALNTQQPNSFPRRNGSLSTDHMKSFSSPLNFFCCTSSPLSSLLRLRPYITPLWGPLHPTTSTSQPFINDERT